MRVLIIDNTIDPRFHGSDDLRRSVREHLGTTSWVRRAPDADLPSSPAGFDAIVVSGSLTSALDRSPWVMHLEAFVRKAVEMKKPYLGVCFGHQILARALGGGVKTGGLAEYGWTEIHQLEENALLKGLPQSFFTFSSHQDEVSSLPKGFRWTAKSQRCAIQMIEAENHPTFGIQFHPEKSLQECEESLKEKAKESPQVPLLDAQKSKVRFNPDVGSQIFGNFFREVIR
jgi:GMP synthase-like glutamine amidotransferase